MWTVILLSLLIPAKGPIYEDATADQWIRQALQASYNMDLDEARSLARKLQEKYPDHPAGYNLYSETYWWEALRDPQNSDAEKKYFASNGVAVEKAEQALKAAQYPRNEILAYLASAQGSFARFQVTQKGAYFSALRAGLRAHRNAQSVFNADSSFYDIYVGIGAYNYFTGSLPVVIKPFAFLIGARGDKELGLEQLRTAIDKGRYARTEARIVYYTALLEEKRYPQAFEQLQKLQAESPTNNVYYLWVSDWFQRQNKFAEGADHFERTWDALHARYPATAAYALLEKAILLKAGNRSADARQVLRRVRTANPPDSVLLRRLAELESRIK